MPDTQDATINKVAEECYVKPGQDNIVGLFWIIHELKEHLTDPESRMDDTLQIIRVLLQRGMLAGDPPYYPDGHKPWTDQHPEAVINRIREEWHALDREPDIPDIVWFGPKF